MRFEHIFFLNFCRQLLKLGYIFCPTDFIQYFLCGFIIHPQRLFKFYKKLSIINRFVEIFQKLFSAARNQVRSRSINKAFLVFIGRQRDGSMSCLPFILYSCFLSKSVRLYFLKIRLICSTDGLKFLYYAL